ncbi:hypothetical protein [Acinetobacter kyonggiensis]|uniref:Uncharacterized protein n=1 Tax=Acinetobacter kyonggiensis TaxID=595670 RepID=A0A1H3NPR9_9GAMM|nr:hypothetical protein [Acinetobacter kyonggiensis]SDY90892.1 hypothetical protein SAMN05421643_1573 [Acinetobacter kyonggiensis]
MMIHFEPEMFDPQIVHAVACFKLDSFKFFPLDSKSRNIYFYKKYIEYLIKIGRFKDTEKYIKEILIDHEMHDLKKIEKNGYLAGSKLIHLLSMENLGQQPILEKAKYAYQEWNMSADRSSLKHLKTKGSSRSIENTWNTYKSVSHLWAIDIFLLENEVSIEESQLSDLPGKSVMELNQDSRYYLAYVKAMEKKLDTLGLKNFDFIRLPEFPIGLTLTIKHTVSADQVKKIFSNYTHISSKKQ